MPFVRTIDREKAVFLRKLGIPLIDIANILDCSPAWCYKNLSSVKIDRKLVNELVNKLQSEGDGYA